MPIWSAEAEWYRLSATEAAMKPQTKFCLVLAAFVVAGVLAATRMSAQSGAGFRRAYQ